MLSVTGNTRFWAICAAAALGSFGLNAADQPQALRNFQEVSDSLCRGAQPSAEGFRELAKLGVHTVVDLRGAGGRSSQEAEIVRSLGMEYVNVPLDGFQAPTPVEVSKVLAVLDNPGSGKVFVHCRRGADRTGTVLALYRIEHDHWSNQQALDEAKTMKMANSERLMQKFVMEYNPAVAAAN
jgi:tyrosine-protein phosphatase SIW14